MKILKAHNILPLILVLILLYPQSLSAIGLSGTTDIRVLQPIKIEELQNLNYGTIQSPSSNVLVAVSLNGNVIGSADYVDTSDVQIGKYKVTGSETETVSLNAQSMNNYDDIKYLYFFGKYNGNFINLSNGASNLAPPGQGANLDLSALMLVKAGVPEGAYQPAFQIECIYD